MVNDMKKIATLLIFPLAVVFTGCTTVTTGVNDTAGRKTVYEDVNTGGAVAGVGIESQDISSMTDKMMRDIFSTPSVAGRAVAPNVIIDDKYFVNESSSRINKRLITERLMVHLNRASQGRMVFVERAAAEMVESERELKRSGTASEGALGSTRAVAGADFRLSGRIMSLDSVSSSTGVQARYHQISFKLVDLETGVAVWTGLYEFKKAAQDDIVYR